MTFGFYDQNGPVPPERVTWLMRELAEGRALLFDRAKLEAMMRQLEDEIENAEAGFDRGAVSPVRRQATRTAAK